MNGRRRTPPGLQPTPDYRAYLLRLWREGEDASWRCSLQAADGAERIGFSDLEQLVTYLLRLVDDDGKAPWSPPSTGPPA